MKCYFCQNELELDTTQPQRDSPHWDIWKSCDYCTSTHGVHAVITALDTQGQLQYAYIHLDKPDYDYDAHRIPGEDMFKMPEHPNYIIRLNLYCNTTDVYYYHLSPTMVLHLPGYPMNPANAREKFKLYLLFS